MYPNDCFLYLCKPFFPEVVGVPWCLQKDVKLLIRKNFLCVFTVPAVRGGPLWAGNHTHTSLITSLTFLCCCKLDFFCDGTTHLLLSFPFLSCHISSRCKAQILRVLDQLTINILIVILLLYYLIVLSFPSTVTRW